MTSSIAQVPVDNTKKEKKPSAIPPLKPYTGATETSKGIFKMETHGPVTVPNTIAQEPVGSPKANPGPDEILDDQTTKKETNDVI